MPTKHTLYRLSEDKVLEGCPPIAFGLQYVLIEKTTAPESPYIIGVATKVTWDNKIHDIENEFASDKFTPKHDGTYQLTVHLYHNAHTGSHTTKLKLYKNGVQDQESVLVWGGSSHDCSAARFTITPNGTTDYYEIYFEHNGSYNYTWRGPSVVSIFTAVRYAE